MLDFPDQRVLLALVLAALIVPSSAHASVADEQHQGQQLAEQVQSGQRTCRSLSPTDLDHIGEFVMGRMAGSTSAHEAMNQRMTQVLGEQAESRMHQVLGARFVGCAEATAGPNGRTAPTGPGSMMGNGPTMGPGPGPGGWEQREWGAMMRSRRWGSMMNSGAWPQMMGPSGDWSWMMGSRWQGMSTSQWQTVQKRLLATTTVRASASGWTARDTVLIAVAAILAAGALGALFTQPPSKRGS